jgi:multidrug efflux pump subunit AcrA (membrane-fusion protein)
MRRSQIILLAVFLVISGGIYFQLSSNKKEHKKSTKEEVKETFLPVKKVSNKPHTISLTSYGQVMPNTELLVSFELQGKLKKGDINMKPGTNFRTGQILYTLDNEEAFYALAARKSSLSNLIISALPDIEMDFPSEKNKWLNFLDDLRPGKILPELPRLSSAKERMFLTSRNILPEYLNLKSQEVRMNKYIYVAPFNGTVIETYAEPASIVNPGVQIAKIAKTNELEVKVPISMEDLALYKEKSSAAFINPNGRSIATGKIIRVSNVINQQTQSADVYYSIKPNNNELIYNGMYVNVRIDQEATKNTFVIPRTALKNGRVNILKNNSIHPQDVIVVGSKPDSVYVSGLNNGQMVILEQVAKIDKETKYSGVNR